MSDTKTKLFVLSDYEEHGSTNMQATTNPDSLHEMVSAFVDGYSGKGKAMESIEILKAKGWPIDANGHNLTNEWGGPLLHIIELEP